MVPNVQASPCQGIYSNSSLDLVWQEGGLSGSTLESLVFSFRMLTSSRRGVGGGGGVSVWVYS